MSEEASALMKRLTSEFRRWWWAATLTISSFFGLGVMLVFGEPTDLSTFGNFALAFFIGVMSGIGLQRSFRWMTIWYRTELALEQPRGVSVRVGGVACLILAGLVFVVGFGLVATFEQSHTGLLWEIVSSELFISAFVFSGLGLVAVGIRLYKGRWLGKGFWSAG